MPRKRSDLSDKSGYYTVTHPEEFQINWKAFYDKIDEMTAATRKEFPHQLDIPYGEDPKQRLDIYLPKGKPYFWPVFLFLHGGGFREGDRAHYGFVASPFAKHNILTVVASYRLTPEHSYPHQLEDVRHALAWVFHNIESFGGDPAHIHVGGHSAGAVLAGLVSFKTDWLTRFSLPPDLIKGCALVSASYDLRNEDWVEEFLPNCIQRAEASPLLNVANSPFKTVVGVGSVGEPEQRVIEGSRKMVEKLQANGSLVEMAFLEGMDHAGTALGLGDENSPLFQAIQRMINCEFVEEMATKLHAYYALRTHHRLGPGKKPAVIVIDLMRGTNDLVSFMASTFYKEIKATVELLKFAHAKKVPVIFVVVEYAEEEPSTNLICRKTPWVGRLKRDSRAVEVHPSLTVEQSDLIIRKKYNSAFFGTDLASQLAVRSIDTLLICGVSTAGCVRATAVDAAQSGFRPLVVREAVGDRSRLAHEANLLDIDLRYGDVISLEEAVDYLSSLNQRI